MATTGPVSVLDSGSREDCHIYRDRLTRRCSPGPQPVKPASPDDEEELIYRYPQPYRTSFSATLQLERGKRSERSRSLSPATSLLSTRSDATTFSTKSSKSHKKGGRNRSKSPKRVTYNNKVTIRQSGKSDSMVTGLSSPPTPPASSPNPFSSSTPHYMDNLSNREDYEKDYSAQLREISQQIMEWSPPTSGKTSPSSILKEHMSSESNLNNVRPNLTSPSRSPVRVTVESYENKENFSRPMSSYSDTSPKDKLNMSREYIHDRSVSYRKAVHDQYSDDFGPSEDSGIDTKSPDVRRDNSAANSPTESNSEDPSPGRLTPHKRGNSISNFFKRISPHMNRRKSREKHGKSGNGSAQSLSNTSDGGSLDTDNDSGNEKRMSRSKVRQSLMRLMGRSKSRSKNKDSKDSKRKEEESKSKDFLDNVQETQILNNKQQFPASTNRILKSIERNTLSDKDIHQKMKENHSRRVEDNPAYKGIPVRTSPDTTSSSNEMSQYMNESYGSQDHGVNLDTSAISSDYRVDPPRSLDILPPRSVKVLQTSVISSTSGDDSIGECSLDVNMTASDATVLSGASQSGTSKQVALSQDLVKSTDSRHEVSSLTKKPREKPHFHSVLLESNKENAIPHKQSPTYHSDSDSSPLDPARKPSYLKISCAVSGYGSFSQYTSYKDIEKRSPYSSNNSVTSDPNSPENAMPSVRDIHAQKLSDDRYCAGVGQGFSKSTINGSKDINGVHVNGHSYPTGDRIKDGEYFLRLTDVEEERLLVLCSQADTATHTQSLPEEASGRIRAAIGKANLLINKRFQQFRELCKDHQYPDPDAKTTKWEDLQGFWDMVKIQVDDVDEMFTEIDLMRNNGWKEIPLQISRRSSASSSPKSGSLSQNSTPGHTPGSKRKTLKPKETPESSPERSQKARQAAKARDEARKKLLAEKRAAMKQQQNEQKGVEIYLTEGSTK